MRLLTADGRELWLTYCMNVHEGSVEGQRDALRRVVGPLRRRLGAAGAFGVGLRLDAPAVDRLLEDEALREAFTDDVVEEGFVPFTANGFVVGDFHGRPLKDEVYRPSWRRPERAAYTLGFADLLIQLARRAGLEEVSLSTAPLAWRAWGRGAEERDGGARALAEVATGLARRADESGVRVRLGLEPEPGCSLDRTPDAAAFLARDVRPLLGTPAAWEHLGLCYDVCHQAVMHEDVEEGLDATRSQGVAVAKAQLTCALEATDPRDPRQREALGAFDETTYLHQVGGRGADGAFRLVPDLGPALAGRGGLDETAPWRVHFHVPLFRRDLVGGLSATRPQLETLLARVAARPTTSHLEIETYTFDVLPESEKEAGSGHDLVDALEREYRAVLGILARHGVRPVEAGEDR